MGALPSCGNMGAGCTYLNALGEYVLNLKSGNLCAGEWSDPSLCSAEGGGGVEEMGGGGEGRGEGEGRGRINVRQTAQYSYV